MERLQARLKDTQAEEAAMEGMGTIPNPMEEGDVPIEDALSQHLRTLDEPSMEFLATHFTPNFAQAVGMLTGSEGLYTFLMSRADQSKLLVPLPKEAAMKLMQQPAEEGTAPTQGMPMEQAPTGPSEGAMSLPM